MKKDTIRQSRILEAAAVAAALTKRGDDSVWLRRHVYGEEEEL